MGIKIGWFMTMTTHSLFFFFTVYLALVMAVVLGALHRRIPLIKVFLISFFLTPISGLLALFRASRKVVVTYYNPLNRCPDCPAQKSPEPEICRECEFLDNLRRELTVKRRFFI